MSLAKLAEALIQSRRTLEISAGEEFFSDPVRDMLLDLFVRSCRGKQTTIHGACMASFAPPTTALRHLKNMEAGGLITSRVAEHGGPLRIVELTPKAWSAIIQSLEESRRLLGAALV